jgi:hypothetical protein
MALCPTTPTGVFSGMDYTTIEHLIRQSLHLGIKSKLQYLRNHYQQDIPTDLRFSKSEVQAFLALLNVSSNKNCLILDQL